MRCFHCLQAVTDANKVESKIPSEENIQLFCCHGCVAASQWIYQQNLESFYTQRDANALLNVSETQTNINLDALNILSLEDQVWQWQVEIPAIHCASCAWLLEQVFLKDAAAQNIEISIVHRRLRLTWQGEKHLAHTFYQQLIRLGYPPSLDVSASQQETLKQKRQLLKQVAVSGFLSMQVMMLAVGLYLGDYQDIDPLYERFFSLLSLLLATSVMWYSGRVFFQGAYNALKVRRLNMDVPIALALLVAYSSSVLTLFVHLDLPLYFDSIVMLIFFILLGRYLERFARNKLLALDEAFIDLEVTKVEVLNQQQWVSQEAAKLIKGDVIKLSSGDVIPVDCCVLKGAGEVDRSLLNGESQWVHVKSGDELESGTKLESGEMQAQVLRMQNESTLEQLKQHIVEAQFTKNPSLILVDKIAGYFVAVVLVIATLGLSVWWSIDSFSMGLKVFLAVLVASCPCALSLATPAVLTRASSVLRKKGVLLSRLDVLFDIARIKLWVLDKTGALTAGKPEIIKEQVYENSGQLNLVQARRLAAMLLHGQKHPLAHAFAKEIVNQEVVVAKQIFSGLGTQACIDGEEYFLGRPVWVLEKMNTSSHQEVEYKHLGLLLANQGEVIAGFSFSDQLRAESKSLVDFLKQKNIEIAVLTGDKKQSAFEQLQSLNLKRVFAELLPQQKADWVQNEQPSLVLGDGHNDAPALASAKASVSLAHGSAISQSCSDVVVMKNELHPLMDLKRVSDQSLSVMRQNIFWAIGYNVSVLPLALSGMMTPWQSAIGMSLSSLCVIVNALRIK